MTRDALRSRAPAFAAFFGRPSDALDVTVFLALVGGATAWSIYGAGPSRSAVVSAVAVLSAVQISLFVWALAALVRAVTRRAVDTMAYPIAATAVVVVLAADRVHYGFFREHLSFEACREAWVAARAGALLVDRAAVLAGAFSAVVLAIVLAVLLKGLSFVPRSPAAPTFVRRAALPVLLVVATASSLRECALDPPSPALAPMRRAIPWDGVSSIPDAPRSVADDRAAALFGDARPWGDALEHGARLLASPLRSRSRPDILVIHVESLRADMIRDDVAPRIASFASECLTTPFHYTTGTNTGTGVFGLLTGLTAPYYPLARAAHAQPLPLAVLRKLGYGIGVFFTSNFGSYDGLYDLYFKGLADFTYHGPEHPVFDADAKMVDAYIAQRRSRAAGAARAPRFDYLILDSTHYDYSYPPEIEKFKPAMTLDLGVRDGLVMEEGINEKVKWRAPFIRNRYQNSVLWADTLVGRVIDALRETNQMDDTIVVVTGDHGEEFWEHGAFGHGFFDLSNEQTRVPFLMHLPGGGTSRYRYSSHADLFPTVFDAIGLEPGDAMFMSGKSLLRYDPSQDVAVVGFGVTGAKVDPRYAVVGDGLKVYWRNVAPFDVTEVTSDTDDVPAPSPAPSRIDDLVLRAIAAKGLR